MEGPDRMGHGLGWSQGLRVHDLDVPVGFGVPDIYLAPSAVDRLNASRMALHAIHADTGGRRRLWVGGFDVEARSSSLEARLDLLPKMDGEEDHEEREDRDGDQG